MRLIIFLSTVLFSLSVLAYPPSNPVQWGGEEGMDACGGFGYVMATTVMVTQDSRGYMSFNRVIPAGTPVTFCDYESGYHGILIHQDGVSCGGGSANVPQRRDYDGPCESGWIKETFLEFLAG